MAEPLKLLSIEKLLASKFKFFIPAYQRGYRWRAEQVKLLIQDIQQYIDENNRVDSAQDKCPYYSLQAIVVKEKDKGSSTNLEVIDGQQRLTTILIILQAYYTFIRKDFLKLALQHGINSTSIIDDSLFTVEYETRNKSSKWLTEITNAYLKDDNSGNREELEKLENENSDYYHFVEAFETAIDSLKDFKADSDSKLYDFIKTLKKNSFFIWYNISQTDASDSEVDIFDRLNATKIALNNAELIKAIFLQESHFGNKTHKRNQLAIDWDRIEKRLQDPSFWGFIYSTQHPYKYETHIEYIFDLLQRKTKDEEDNFHFTFNAYYNEYIRYIESKDKLKYVEECWEEVNETMLMLEEWYNDKTCYHYIGYLLEYGDVQAATIKELASKLKVDVTEVKETCECLGYKDADNQLFVGECVDEIISSITKKYDNKNKVVLKKSITIPILKELLQGCSKHERNEKLKALIRNSLTDVKAHNQFYKHSGNNLKQLLFLLNIETEERRKSDTARFSFSEYKKIDNDPGWNLEHVASNTDYVPTYEEKEKLAYSLLEYFTGIKKSDDIDDEKYKKSIELIEDSKEKELCDDILGILQIKENNEENINEIKKIYTNVLEFFCSDKDDFKYNIEYTGGKKNVHEKDFIWNFALLNASTNKSYGNDIYPLKRKRIISDEESVYTPICTRAMFEKAYSKKLKNLMAWTRTDAYDYWNYICDTLKEFLPSNFELPFNYNKPNL